MKTSERKIKIWNNDFTFSSNRFIGFGWTESEIWQSNFYKRIKPNGASSFTSIGYLVPLWKSNQSNYSIEPAKTVWIQQGSVSVLSLSVILKFSKETMLILAQKENVIYIILYCTKMDEVVSKWWQLWIWIQTDWSWMKLCFKIMLIVLKNLESIFFFLKMVNFINFFNKKNIFKTKIPIRIQSKMNILVQFSVQLGHLVNVACLE